MVQSNWMVDAAKEIDTLHHDWFFKFPVSERTMDKPVPDERVLAIRAIILKHCPEDKAVEKLVEALIEARVRLGFPVGTQQPNGFFSIEYHAVADTVKIIDDALADYEAKK